MISRRLIAPALLASLLAACGDDTTPPDNQCTAKGTFIRIDTPAEGALLTDDVSSTLPQFQATIAASTDLPSGQNVQVIVNGQVLPATATVASGKIESQVTLLNGSNTVVFSATVCGKPIKGAVTVSVAPDGCEFVTPAEGTPIDGSADTDTSKAGVQTSVSARCKTFTQGEQLSLRINAVEVAQGAFDDKGAVTFAGVSFYPGRVALTMMKGAEKKLSTSYDVSIEGECPVSIEPVADTMFNVGGDPSEIWVSARGDADVETAGIQADLTVTTDCQDPTKAHVSDMNGVELGVAAFEAGKAVVRILVPEGDFGLRPAVEASGKVQPGNPAGYHSDSVVPNCVIDAPANGGAAEDIDPVTPDVQFQIRGHCENVDPGSIVELRISQASSDPRNTAKTAELAADGTFTFDWQVVAGDYKAWVGGVRPSGNRSPATANVNRFVAGVPSCAITEPAANLATASTSVDVKVKSNVDPGTDIVITVKDPSGGTQSQTVKAVPSPAGGTQATATLTLATKEGTHEISAQCGTIGQAVPVSVQYDLTGPALTVEVPGSGVINQAVSDAVPGGGFDVLVTVTADAIQDGSTGAVSFKCIPSNTVSAADGVLSFMANKATATLSLANVPEGDNCTFTANATDKAGNPAAPAKTSAIYDRVGPVIVSSFPAGAFELVANGNPRINGTTVLANLFVNDTPTVDMTFQTAGAVGGQLVVEEPAVGKEYARQSISPDGAVVLPSVILPQGRTLNLDIKVTDAAANVTTLQRTVTTDVVPPGTPTDVSLKILDAQAATATLSLTEPAGDYNGTSVVGSYEARWSPLTNLDPAQAFQDDTLAAPATAPVPAAVGGTATSTVSFPPLGSKLACVRAVDSAGNRGSIACASTSEDWSETKFTSSQAGGLLGLQVLSLPSVDGDALPDLVVAERARTNGGGVATGAVHLFSGNASLATALTSPRITLFGTDAGERCGEFMATGDFDGDGTPDLAVGCSRFSASRGRVMVYFGGIDDVNGDGKNDGFSETVRAIVNGPTGTALQFGASVASIGDLDGDGRDELLVSDHNAGAGGTGDAYVLMGRSRATWATATVADSSSVKITGESNGDAFSYRWGAGTLGDLDGDGKPEVLVPASAVNKVYVFSGADIVKALGGTLAASKGTVIQEDAASAPGIVAGSLLAGFGHRSIGGHDVTGDGFPDAVVADSFNGKIRVFKGSDALNALETPPSQLLSWPGGAALAFGYSIVLADLTGDGTPDLVVGNNATANGAMYVYRASGKGGDAPFEAIPATKALANVNFGVAVGVIDLDGDGTDELVVGAPTDGNGTIHVYSVP